MITIAIEKLDPDRTNERFGYLFYGDAKQAGVRRGTQFQLALGEHVGQEVLEAVEYVGFRPDTNRTFKGFRCQVIN